MNLFKIIYNIVFKPIIFTVKLWTYIRSKTILLVLVSLFFLPVCEDRQFFSNNVSVFFRNKCITSQQSQSNTDKSYNLISNDCIYKQDTLCLLDMNNNISIILGTRKK
jgi:hypothetical protein